MSLAVDRMSTSEIGVRDSNGNCNNVQQTQMQRELNFLRIQFPEASLHMQQINKLIVQTLRRGEWEAWCLVTKRILGDLMYWKQQLKPNLPLYFEMKRMMYMMTADALRQKLRLKEFKFERISSFTDGYQEVQGIADTKYNTIDINRQHSSGVSDKKMKGQERTIEDSKEVERPFATSQNRIQDQTQSRSIEFNCERVMQVGNERRLLSETGSVQLSSDRSGISSSGRQLRESNEQTVKRILQHISGQKRISSQYVQLSMDYPHDVSTSIDNNDIRNINKDSERWCRGNADCAQMEGINMGRDVDEHVEEENNSGTSEPSSRVSGE
ncbi:MAG: hypothetical protein EZS28_037012, partial [Streblomastix strix]